MKSKVITGTVLAVLLLSMFTSLFKIQLAKAPSEETVGSYYSFISYVASSYNDGNPVFAEYHVSGGGGNCTASPPDENGVINITVTPGPVSIKYNPIFNLTTTIAHTLNPYGKVYTNDSVGDVDIISMTNDTGMFFLKNGTWHPAGEEWMGDGTPDPAGSAWLTTVTNTTQYFGNGTDGPCLGSYVEQVWQTTGYSENTVVETASRLNGFHVNATGAPYIGDIATFVFTKAKLNIPWWLGNPLDMQSKTDQITYKPPAFVATLFSPASLYVTDPLNRHIGTHPTTGNEVNEIPGAVYSGPESEHQRIAIPDPVDGVYDIRIVGTGIGEYTSVIEYATEEKLITDTYGGNISAGQIWESEANISEGEMTATEPVLTSAVGGIYIPVNKLGLLAPYVALVSTILVATAIIAIYIKHIKHRKEKH